jgi:hypothetical protein
MDCAEWIIPKVISRPPLSSRSAWGGPQPPSLYDDLINDTQKYRMAKTPRRAFDASL